MKNLTFILIFSVSLSCINQSRQEKHTQTANNIKQDSIFINDIITYGVCAFLDVEYFEFIDIYDKPNGNIIKTIKHDVKNMDYIMFDILSKNDTMFYVNAYFSYSGKSTKGWIKKSKYIGIYSHYDGLTPLLLYTLPDKKSKYINTKIEGYNPNTLTVIDYNEKWLKVKLELNKKNYVGWLAPQNQCCNIYTTCN